MEAINALEDPQEIRIDFFSMFYCFSNSINQYSKSSNDFVILIVPFISSIKMKKNISFSALTYLSIALEAKLLTNRGTLSLAKKVAKLLLLFYLTYLTRNQKIHLIELF